MKEYVSGRLKAADQLDRYAEQIKDGGAAVPREYSNHLPILQPLLPMSLPPHPKLELAAWPLFLLVLGDPEDEKDRENLRRKLESPDLDPYPRVARSDPTNIDPAELWDEVDRWPGIAGRAGS